MSRDDRAEQSSTAAADVENAQGSTQIRTPKGFVDRLSHVPVPPVIVSFGQSIVLVANGVFRLVHHFGLMSLTQCFPFCSCKVDVILVPSVGRADMSPR